MTERTYTEAEALRIAAKAVDLANARLPVPPHVTIAQVAAMLEVSTRTVARMNLPRNAMGRIPYEGITTADVPHGTMPWGAIHCTPPLFSQARRRQPPDVSLGATVETGQFVGLIG